MFVVFSCVRELQYHELKISHERASWPWLYLHANILVSIYISQSCSLQISLPLGELPFSIPQMIPLSQLLRMGRSNFLHLLGASSAVAFFGASRPSRAAAWWGSFGAVEIGDGRKDRSNTRIYRFHTYMYAYIYTYIHAYVNRLKNN